jgi:hypothetical protein
MQQEEANTVPHTSNRGLKYFSTLIFWSSIWSKASTRIFQKPSFTSCGKVNLWLMTPKTKTSCNYQSHYRMRTTSFLVFKTVWPVQSANHSCDLWTPIHLCRVSQVPINRRIRSKRRVFFYHDSHRQSEMVKIHCSLKHKSKLDTVWQLVYLFCYWYIFGYRNNIA